jgi:hypothetical protein
MNEFQIFEEHASKQKIIEEEMSDKLDLVTELK